jgi:predicted ATP-grasp superfamily ATP-dependent carboligase
LLLVVTGTRVLGKVLLHEERVLLPDSWAAARFLHFVEGLANMSLKKCANKKVMASLMNKSVTLSWNI